MLLIKNSQIVGDVGELDEFKSFVEHKKNDIANVFRLESLFLHEKLKKIRQQIVQESLPYIGKPSIYYTGSHTGMDESGFDCSGFVTVMLKKFGLDIPDIRHSYEYFDTYGISVHSEHKQPGDLIFFSRKGMVPTHMGIIVSDTSYIHAPGNTDSRIQVSPIVEEVIENSSGDALYSHNPIGYKRIALTVNLKNKRFNKIV